MKSLIIALLYNAFFLSLFSERLLLSTAAPTKGPCSAFDYYSGETNDSYAPVPLDEVRSCLTSFPYDAKIAKETVDSIIKALTGYYVFLDSAREPPKPGNTYDAIDVVSALKALLKHDFKTDYDFMISVTNTLDQLKDAHTNFHPGCYETFVYLQGIDLYSVVDSNGRQSIKVWKDFHDDSNNDCDVTLIDGVPAVQAIEQYAREDIGLARDLGVRFNLALNSLSVDGTSEISNQFSRRQYLPPTNEITYTLKCSGTEKKVVRTWTACGWTNSLLLVTNSQEYWEYNCLPDDDYAKTRPSPYRKLSNRTASQQQISSSPTNDICGIIHRSPVNLNNGQLLLDINPMKFYYLPEQNTGVVVIIDLSVFPQDSIMKGLQKFIDKGVKKVIFDLTGTEEGFILAVHVLVNLLFPKTDPFFNTDFMVSDLFQLHALTAEKLDFEETVAYYGEWDDPRTGDSFKDAASFIGDNNYTRGGVTKKYTSKLIEGGQFPTKVELPWQATDYAILTNGLCGSECSLAATHLAEENNVLTVSVGGLANTPMAFASFPGGDVYSLFDITYELNLAGLSDNPLSPKPLPINGDLTFAIREAYSKSNPEEVLEFSYRPATKRLYYDSKSARDPSELWVQVAALLQAS